MTKTLLATTAWLLVATAAWGVVSWPVTVVTKQVTAAGDTPVAANNCLSSTVMVQLFEEADTVSPIVDSGSGANDNFTEVGATTRNTTTPPEGAQSATVAYNTNYFSCADATCTGIDWAAGNSFTWGCRTRVSSLPTAATDYIFAKTTSSTGYYLASQGTVAGDPTICSLQRATDINAVNDLNTRATGTWYHEVCVADDPGSVTVTPYVNAQADTAATNTGDYTVTVQTAYLGTVPAAGGIAGDIDECFADNSAWTAAQVAAACSGTIARAKLKCSTADNTKYMGCNTNTDCGGSGICDTGAGAIDDPSCTADTTGNFCSGANCAGCCMGDNSTMCNGVTLPACNAACP